MNTSDEPWDYLFKFIIIGNSGSGKSCLLHSFLESKFRKNSAHTVGVEFGSKVLQVGEKRVKLQIWDTAGQERFRAVTRSYYRGSAGVILVYDISNRPSFQALSHWLAEARELSSEDIVAVLVGNKCDLQEEREVSYLEASRFAQENDMVFLETSALNGDSVTEVFSKCARRVLARLADGLLDFDKVSVSTPGGPMTRHTAASGVADDSSSSRVSPGELIKAGGGGCSC